MIIRREVLRIPTTGNVGLGGEGSCVSPQLNRSLRAAGRRRGYDRSGDILVARKGAITGIERTILAPKSAAASLVVFVDELIVGTAVIRAARPVRAEVYTISAGIEVVVD